MRYRIALMAAVLGFLLVWPSCGDDSERLVAVDHYVPVRSTVPAIAGQTAQIYVREVTRAGAVLRTGASAGRVVLFGHGARTPAEVAFDVSSHDFGWMRYLTGAGLTSSPWT